MFFWFKILFEILFSCLDKNREQDKTLVIFKT